MAEQLHTSSNVESSSLQQRVRDWFAESLGVSQEKKEEIYLQISRSATLVDFSYWSQVLFSAGIATLGLALNSPAVIIGAMLISPLMGPILASGLALAAGDFVLGTRAAVNLFLSCLVSIFFAVVFGGPTSFQGSYRRDCRTHAAKYAGSRHRPFFWRRRLGRSV
jgi:hypothetical protein